MTPNQINHLRSKVSKSGGHRQQGLPGLDSVAGVIMEVPQLIRAHRDCA
jgi:hypothetical protein